MRRVVPPIASSDPESENRIRHVFSIDVEEYFQVSAFDQSLARDVWPTMPSRVERSVDRLLELLAVHDAFATFFTLGWVAERHPELVRRIADAGHEIASHGWSHRRVSALTPDAFREELRTSKTLLEDLSGQEVLGFRAPSFSIGREQAWAFNVLIEEGYRYDSSVFPIRRPGYGDPDAPTSAYVIRCAAGSLLELPMATAECLGMRLPAAGGGYLRHFPFGVIRRGVRAHEARGESAMLYVHPWEIDETQPRLPVTTLTRLRHYGGLRRTLPRLERLLDEFRFTSVARLKESALRGLGRSTVPAPAMRGANDVRQHA